MQSCRGDENMADGVFISYANNMNMVRRCIRIEVHRGVFGITVPATETARYTI